MFEKLKLMMANQYFDRRMKAVLVDRVCARGIETFETYLAYRYRDNCYYYSGYAIMGMEDDDYLMRGNLCINGDIIFGKGGYSHGWVEFKYKGQDYVFDSMCRGVVPKSEWYKEFKPKITFKQSKKEIVESMIASAQLLEKGCYQIHRLKLKEDPNDLYYTDDVYEGGKFYLRNGKVQRFLAYSEPSG